VTFYIWVKSDKSHRRRPRMSIQLYDKEEGGALVKIKDEVEGS